MAIAQAYDYIVIGSGSAGGFVTYRLSEQRDVTVLLLEAGVSDAHWTTRMPAGARYAFTGGIRNWCFATEPEPHMNGRRIFQPRGKVIGGSSSLNGMVYVRGHRLDFAEWVSAGAAGWGHDDVLRHFKAIERYVPGGNRWRGDRGPVVVEKLTADHAIEQAFLEAGVEAGHRLREDYNGAEQDGVCAFDANIDAGWRCGTARACVRPAMRRPNVSVLTRAHATRIDIEGGRAVGVRFRRRGADCVARARREVIVSAGAIQTPQLLMLSGIGPADHLRAHGIRVVADLPGVGANLQDHLECHMKYACAARGMSKNGLLTRRRMLLAGLQWLVNRSGPAATTHSRVGGFFRSGPDATHPDIQFHFWPYWLDGWKPPPDRDGFVFDVGPTKPSSRGWVKLACDDPFAAPLMRLDGLSHPGEMKVFRRAIRIARDIARQKAFDFCRGAEIEPGPDATSDDDLDGYVRSHANSAYHPCGTAAMGSGAMAVCDAGARVRGIEGLRVADASLMPTIPNGNLNAPAMMIGEKVAAMIRAGN